MTLPDAPTPNSRPWTADLRVGLVSAGLMLAIPLGAKLATRFGWVKADDFAQRALMVILAGFIAFTGNTIPKRLESLACLYPDPARWQAFYRFAGWTWVLAGIGLGLAWILLRLPAAGTATLILVPAAMSLVGLRWLGLRATRRPAA